MFVEEKGVEVNLTRIKGNKIEEISDLVARETIFTILLNKKKLVTLNCSPEKYKYLGLGFLYTSGILQKKENIISLIIDEKQGLMDIKIKGASLSPEDIINSNLWIGSYQQSEEQKETPLSIDTSLKISSGLVSSLISEMQERSNFFKLTGGVHSCALVDKQGSIILFSEDISRYNTVDKILGEAFVNDISTEDKIILTSCRITSGILKKIIIGKLSMVISRAAPTDLAIKLAKRMGITLVGFVRERRMNIYTHPQRIEI
ncbi:MAG: formate dehydrogenase accessory sulfurtransferase FdhD [Candidatus Atribacteria bacterium]|nr:formate dehydrogenase accessory sulfurtransferase FdhD [Candidatus Atribacteria bacterium]MBE3092988.1 formate dehydrogenase accessory sulfurtransferase FdhD [Chloroflexota bacterium]